MGLQVDLVWFPEANLETGIHSVHTLVRKVPK